MLKRLLQHSAIYGVSTILGRLMSYMLTPYYTRVFEREEFGVITDIYAIIPLLLVLLTMGMENSYFHFASRMEDGEAGRKRLFGTAWGVTSAAAILLFVVSLIFRAPLSRAMGEVYVGHDIFLLSMVAIAALDVISAVPFARLRERGDAKKYALLKLSNIAMQVGFTFAFGWMGLYQSQEGVAWVLIANIIASCVTLAMLLLFGGEVTMRVDRGLLRKVLAYSVPLVLSGVAGTATLFIDRQLIKFLTPVGAMAQLGLYGAVVKIAVIMTLFTQVYRTAAEPLFLSNISTGEFKSANAKAMKFFLLASMVIFLTITLFSDIFALFVGERFRDGVEILPLILIGNILSGVWLNLSFWYKHENKTHFALWITLCGLAATTVANMALIPTLGYMGAAWARLIAEGVMVAVSLYLNVRYFPTPYPWGRICEYVVVTLGVYILSQQIGQIVGTGSIVGYMINGVLLLAVILYAIKRERIDVGSLVRVVLKR